MDRSGSSSWMERIDWVRVVRGASAGFTVLVLVGLSAPILSTVGPWAPLAWLMVGSLAGYIVAALKVGDAESPMLTGAWAAFFGYTLTVPMIYISTRTLELQSVLMFAGAAVLVGGTTGYLMGRRHTGSS